MPPYDVRKKPTNIISMCVNYIYSLYNQRKKIIKYAYIYELIRSKSDNWRTKNLAQRHNTLTSFASLLFCWHWRKQKTFICWTSESLSCHILFSCFSHLTLCYGCNLCIEQIGWHGMGLLGYKLWLLDFLNHLITGMMFNIIGNNWYHVNKKNKEWYLTRVKSGINRSLGNI